MQLVAMADAFRDRLEGSHETLTNTERRGDIAPRVDVPAERRFVGFDAYREVLPLVDVVILTTPPHFRPIHFAAAVAAGKQIFMEKPVATDAPGIRSLLATAEEAKGESLNVVVGVQRHYQTVYREWVERLHAGMIGDIVLGRVYWNSGGVWVRERERGQTEMECQMRNLAYQTAHVVESLRRAADILEPHALVMVLEPLNYRNHPGLFLTKISQPSLLFGALLL